MLVKILTCFEWLNVHIVNDLCLQLQLKLLFSVVLNSTRKTPSQLDSSTFVALGHIVCGIDAPIMRILDPVEFRLNYLNNQKIHCICVSSN